MNFAKSLRSVSNLTVRTLNWHSRSVQNWESLSSRNFRVSCVNRSLAVRKNQLPAISQQTHRFVHFSLRNNNNSNSAVIVKKRPLRKKRFEEQINEGQFNVFAYATADEYDLESLHTALTKQDLYETRKFYTEHGQDVLHVRSKYNVESTEPRDIFFFREGSVVLWNCSEPESKTILRNLKQFEIGPYDEEMVKAEKEIMSYSYVDEQKGNLMNEIFYIQPNEAGDLEKYTFSNAMISSVKLGIWESMLETYIDGLANVTNDLKNGRRIRISRSSILRKTGELFALKHLINLDSGTGETPDFYWDREALEQLFTKTSSYFSIPKRKKVSDYVQIFLLHANCECIFICTGSQREDQSLHRTDGIDILEFE